MKNREIKFRAWNKEKKVIVYSNEDNSAEYGNGSYGSPVEWVNEYLSLSKKESFASPYVSVYEWMQYTGLKDRKGNEIYEGDVLHIRNVHGGSTGKKFRVVEWKEKQNGTGFNLGDANSTENHEIIGNIYENPGLIK